MLTLTKLKGAEYLLTSVAAGLEDYFMGVGEAPGIWRGRWAPVLGLEGVVEADHLRALVNGLDPRSGVDLLAGHRERKVAAIDATLSAPKSASLLWAFGSPQVSAAVSLAVVAATEEALGFLEDRAALARRQEGGIRRQVATAGFAVATFAHRTSRLGDPQLHTHCLIPNVVRRGDDGTHVAFDANPLHTWAKAAGTVFHNHLQRTLTVRLGVAWGPERNGTREMVGFSDEQLRAFSRRTSAIEARLEAAGEVAYDSAAERMRANDRASLATRPAKDPALSPQRLRQRWATQAAEVGLEPGTKVDDLVVGRGLAARDIPDDAVVFSALVDPTTGLCALQSRFCEAQVVERIAALSAGAMTTEQIAVSAKRFLASEAVVRLAPDAARRRPPQWSTVELRAVEDRLLGHLGHLAASAGQRIDEALVDAAIAACPRTLGDDQVQAVRTLCGPGAAVRLLVAPAGYGKTTALATAVDAARRAGRTVVVAAPTHKAVAELRAAGMQSQTLARLRRQLGEGRLAPGTTVVVDEVSQVATRDAAVVVEALAACPGSQLWAVGDARQAQSVAAGGLVVELEPRAARGTIAEATLTVNRRQRHPGERAALAALRAGDVEASQALRAEHGWEHTGSCPADTKAALATAAVADADRHGAAAVAVLAVSHRDCEDLADAIRSVRAARGELRGPALAGPGWGSEPRTYTAGDRVLVHANLGQVHNGATATVHQVRADGMVVRLDDGGAIELPAQVVGGRRPDGTPNLSHAWARTVDGAQGGTWRQVHLLGTAALDAFRGYVGQSRGQLPTHTWNTAPEPDHPAWLVADDRSAEELVADAMARDEPKSFAAADDPWVLDRQLRAERDEHAAVVATRPPDRSGELAGAGAAIARADEELGWARRGLAYRQAERHRLGGLRRLRPGRRDDVVRADDALAAARRRLERSQSAVTKAQTAAAEVTTAMVQRSEWNATHNWRLARVAEIDAALDHHWAEVILAAVRADDPLAFGIERLRAARRTYHDDLGRLLDAIPPDRRQELGSAEAELSYRRQALRQADRRVIDAQRNPDQAEQSRWGFRDRGAIERATNVAHAAEGDQRLAAKALSLARKRVANEGDAVRAWALVAKESADRRRELVAGLGDIDDALRFTRAERVVALAADPTSGLWAHLGSPPHSAGGLAAWCGVAERIEAWRDRAQPPTARRQRAFHDEVHPLLGLRPHDQWAEWGQLVRLVDRAGVLISAAQRLDPGAIGSVADGRERWAAVLEAAPPNAPEMPAIGGQGRGMEI